MIGEDATRDMDGGYRLTSPFNMSPALTVHREQFSYPGPCFSAGGDDEAAYQPSESASPLSWTIPEQFIDAIHGDLDKRVST